MDQCDQMARLFARFRPITSYKIFTFGVQKFTKICSYFAKYVTLKIAKELFFEKVEKLRQIWSHCCRVKEGFNFVLEMGQGIHNVSSKNSKCILKALGGHITSLIILLWVKLRESYAQLMD